MLGKIVVLELVGHEQNGRVRRRVADSRDCGAHEGALFRGEGELVALLGVELSDGADAQTTLESTESGWPRPGLILVRYPQELFALACTDARPEPSDFGSVADDESTCHATPIRW
jgi:hypothetical protein